ncbi:MAG: cation:proton antiporter [Verrucomicrobia bacterium]|nr:cation:proton antiporter [Verrucomicrobiota bacterium]
MESAMMRLVLQLAVILIAAQLVGLFFKRLLRLPGVLGELIAGMIIGPYALGQLPIPGFGPLFPAAATSLGVSVPLYGLATIASILLLFLSGLETDLALFLRYSVVGTAVGIGGVVFSFVLGAQCGVWFGFANSFMDPVALFLGAISTATSVGITARILSERKKTDSPEGVTILAGAVFDDVLGVVMLAIVVGLSKLTDPGGRAPWGHIGRIAGHAIGYWLGFTAIGLLSARLISRVLKTLHSMSSIVSIAFGLALLFAGLLEMAGLAMIIGAYVTGLSLSRTDLAHGIQEHLRGTYEVFVPVFFCVMGMMVDFSALHGVLIFGLVYAVLAMLAKLLGCGLPAWLMTFNLRGAARIGVGMMPRGEVALVIAGLGLSAHVINTQVFGAAILMTMVTTLIAPPLLSKSFGGGSGLKLRARAGTDETIHSVPLELPSADLAEFVLSRLVRSFRAEEFFVYRLGGDTQAYQIRKDDMSFTLSLEANRVVLTTPARHEHVARFIVLEEILELQDMAHAFEKLQDLDTMKSSLLKGLFEDDD